MIDEIKRIAERLLLPIWNGLDKNYKRRYAVKIWDQFESNIRSASYTNDLSTFLQRMTMRLPVSLNDADIATVLSEFDRDDQRQTLNILRNQTALLVLLVRQKNNERREEKGTLFDKLIDKSTEVK